MLQKLQEKWKVTPIQLILVLITFAVGGSTCAYLGRTLLNYLGLAKSHGLVYYLLYVLVITLLWPLCVIVISIPLGQFVFFKNYLGKVKKRLFG